MTDYTPTTSLAPVTYVCAWPGCDAAFSALEDFEARGDYLDHLEWHEAAEPYDGGAGS